MFGLVIEGSQHSDLLWEEVKKDKNTCVVLVSEWSKVGGGWTQEEGVVIFMPKVFVFVGGIPFLGMRHVEICLNCSL